MARSSSAPGPMPRTDSAPMSAKTESKMYQNVLEKCQKWPQNRTAASRTSCGGSAPSSLLRTSGSAYNGINLSANESKMHQNVLEKCQKWPPNRTGGFIGAAPKWLQCGIRGLPEFIVMTRRRYPAVSVLSGAIGLGLGAEQPAACFDRTSVQMRRNLLRKLPVIAPAVAAAVRRRCSPAFGVFLWPKSSIKTGAKSSPKSILKPHPSFLRLNFFTRAFSLLSAFFVAVSLACFFPTARVSTVSMIEITVARRDGGDFEEQKRTISKTFL